MARAAEPRKGASFSEDELEPKKLFAAEGRPVAKRGPLRYAVLVVLRVWSGARRCIVSTCRARFVPNSCEGLLRERCIQDPAPLKGPAL